MYILSHGCDKAIVNINYVASFQANEMKYNNNFPHFWYNKINN